MKKLQWTFKAFLCLVFLVGLCSCGLPPEPDNTTQVMESASTSHDKEGITDDTLQTKAQEDTIMIDKEYLLAHTNATEEDLEGIDIQDFVEYWGLNGDNISIRNIHVLADDYKKAKKRETFQIDYSYVLQATDDPRSFDPDDVQIVAYMYNTGDAVEGAVFDLRNQILFAGNDMEMFSHCEGSLLGEMDETQRQSILQSVKDANVGAWKPEYSGTNGNTTGSLKWIMAFELSDGSRFSFTGNGIMGDNMPAELMPLLGNLRAICKDMQQDVDE